MTDVIARSTVSQDYTNRPVAVLGGRWVSVESSGNPTLYPLIDGKFTGPGFDVGIPAR